MIGFGLGVLRLSSDMFWGMTPREIARAAEAVYGKAGQGAMDRAALEDLMGRFPDAPPPSPLWGGIKGGGGEAGLAV